MRGILNLFFLLVTITAFTQDPKTVSLRWKIGDNEKLSYLTVMTDIDTGSIEMNFDGLFKILSDSTTKGLNESRDFFKQLNREVKNYDYVSTLTNKGNGIIDIIMMTKPRDKSQQTVTTDSKERIFKMMEGLMLRGSVYETGGIHSFWVKTNQKNLIALLFELPAKPVKVGDRWSLDINLIENDQNFVCDSSYKCNEVTLTDIKKVNGETVAVLKYNIMEYVHGNFYVPSFFGKDRTQTETIMSLTHQGIAEFSVDRGRWIIYDGILSLQATGVMTANKKTKFTLIDEANAGSQ